MIINKIEIKNVDLLDLDVVETYENALELLKSEMHEVEKKGKIKASESIRLQCTSVFKLFNTIFGEGTDKKIFGGKTNLRVCLDSMEELITNMNDNQKETTKYFKTKIDKYSPNRAQRRAKK